MGFSFKIKQDNNVISKGKLERIEDFEPILKSLKEKINGRYK